MKGRGISGGKQEGEGRKEGEGGREGGGVRISNQNTKFNENM